MPKSCTRVQKYDYNQTNVLLKKIYPATGLVPHEQASNWTRPVLVSKYFAYSATFICHLFLGFTITLKSSVFSFSWCLCSCSHTWPLRLAAWVHLFHKVWNAITFLVDWGVSSILLCMCATQLEEHYNYFYFHVYLHSFSSSICLYHNVC